MCDWPTEEYITSRLPVQPSSSLDGEVQDFFPTSNIILNAKTRPRLKSRIRYFGGRPFLLNYFYLTGIPTFKKTSLTTPLVRLLGIRQSRHARTHSYFVSRNCFHAVRDCSSKNSTVGHFSKWHCDCRLCIDFFHKVTFFYEPC